MLRAPPTTHPPTKGLRSRLKPEPSGGRPWEAASGQRHPSRPASRRSTGRPRHLEPDRVRPSAAPESDDGEVAPARDRDASRPSGALTQVPSTAPNPQIPPRAPRSSRAPLTLRPTPAAALLQPGRAGSRRGRGARWARRGGSARAPRAIGPSRRSDRTVGTPARPRQVASAGAGAVLSLPAARCRRHRGWAVPVQARAGTGTLTP